MHGWHDPAAAKAWDRAAGASPGRERELESLCAVLAAVAPARVLEVGVGSGIVAERVLDLLPAARLVGVDYSEPMLALARERLARFGGRATLVRGDLREPAAIRLPDDRFDCAYSVQALHHLPDESKAGVVRWLARVLPPAAIFLLRDKVSVEPALYDAYAAVWRLTGAAMPPSAACAGSLREKGDLPAPLAAHLAWLEQAEFDAGVLDAEGHYVLVAAARR